MRGERAAVVRGVGTACGQGGGREEGEMAGAMGMLHEWPGRAKGQAGLGCEELMMVPVVAQE